MAGPVTLRTASLADCELVFDWANDPVTRAMSFNQAQITRAEHVAWFAASLDDERRQMFVAEDEAGALALVRFSAYEHRPDAAEIGINLAPQRRGQGLGRAVLELASTEAARRGIRRLIARIRPENAASQRAFQRAGYELRAEEPIGEIVALRYEIDLQNR
ncbi:MAG TPA: GNAT family N-acetyltransferase [Polyangiaceae bacterium]|nr:GNAT family N-acetyltransferase [Polyangiaceae bacterium]